MPRVHVPMETRATLIAELAAIGVDLLALTYRLNLVLATVKKLPPEQSGPVTGNNLVPRRRKAVR